MTHLSRQAPPRSVQVAARHLLEVLDPDGRDRFDPEADRRRELTFRHDATGMLVGRFSLDAASGLAFTTAVQAFTSADETVGGTCAPLADTPAAGRDCVEVTEEVPDRLPVPDLRSRAQRQADAVVAMARAALRVGPRIGGEVPRVFVSATLQQLDAARRSAPAPTAGREPADPAEVGRHEQAAVADPSVEAHGRAVDDSGEPISPRLLARLACDSVLVRVLRDANGAVLDLGRGVRTATAAQRKALAVRDGGCVAPGCAVPASGCEAHHVLWWSRGGGTDVRNMALLCPRHHTNVHQGVWSIELRSGIPWMVPSRWIDPQQRPVRNTTHELTAVAGALARQLRLPVESADGRRPDPPWDTPQKGAEHPPDGAGACDAA